MPVTGKDKFFTLTPERVQFDQFWIEIRKRNRWLIMLRYGAVAMLSFLIIGILIIRSYIIEFNVNTLPLWLIASSILIYNIIFHKLWNYLAKKRDWASGKSTEHLLQGFNSLHFSLIQIIIDIIFLLLFVYYTGGVESPLFAFFIFHVIIGSLFLTQEVIGAIVTGIMAVSITGSIFEITGKIPHHAIQGLLASPLYNNIGYNIIYFSIFGISLFTSIYLANSIARELYKRERALNKAYSELENAEKTKSRYVQTVVHDLKTPIAAAVTYLDMLLEGTLGVLSDSVIKPLERSKARLSAAIQTINDVLHISQLKIESSVENIEHINVSDLFIENISDLNVITESKKINLNFICESEEPVIEAETKLIKLTFANLLSNAVKYTEPGGIIEVKINDDKDNLKISIADNGIGIPEKEQAKIFQSFYRSSLSKQKGIEGTGLGMSIVWEVITKYHGKIELFSPSYLNSDSSRPGTQFVVIIPKKFSAI